MTKGSIAAVITCRNLGRMLLEALDSVERQTRPAAEIVVVDDGSTEIHTRQILTALAGAGTRVVTTELGSAAAGRNLGARLTSSEYLVFVDADDILEHTYFEAAAAPLDGDAALDYVSCALRAFGAANYVWVPSPPEFVAAVGSGGVPHASTMMRRTLWEAAGGFDEEVSSYELLDFWASVMERGFRGTILEEPLLRYRVRSGSGYRRSIQPATYRERMDHFYAKHRAAVEKHGIELIQAKEAFIHDQREYQRVLDARVAAVQTELAQLGREIAALSQTLESHGSSRVEKFDLQRTSPISGQWGRDRGTPVDRHYIEAFLAGHRGDIRGRVLEVRDSTYTDRFGGEAAAARDVLDIDPSNSGATVIADLRRAPSIPTGTYDCIILTQTLQLIDDVPAALAECARILRPGGVLLATVPSVIRVDDEGGVDGDFWRLTEASARTLFAAAFPLDAFEVSAYGNVMTCAAFLYGLAAEELPAADLDRHDPNFPLVVTIRAVKPNFKQVEPSLKQFVGSGFSRIDCVGSGFSRIDCMGSGFSRIAVVLAYHRIATLTPDSHRLCTSPDEFREHMDYLRRECTPMALHDLVRAAAAGRLPERAVAITLDDGYLDALTTASPILIDAGVPATFFVNTERLDEPHERWWDVFERIFASETLPPFLAALSLPTTTPTERRSALDRLNQLARPLDADARNRLVAEVLAWSGIDAAPRDTHRVLTRDEVRLLSERPGHTIGAHTAHHLALTRHPADTKRREVRAGKEALERVLQQPIDLFAYPYGEFDGELVAIVKDAGFVAAVTVDGRALSSGASRFLLPRIEVSPHDRRPFAVRMRETFAAHQVSIET